MVKRKITVLKKSEPTGECGDNMCQGPLTRSNRIEANDCAKCGKDTSN